VEAMKNEEEVIYGEFLAVGDLVLATGMRKKLYIW
jgi:hypothetical protein